MGSHEVGLFICIGCDHVTQGDTRRKADMSYIRYVSLGLRFIGCI